MNDLETVILKKVIRNYYKKNKKLPSYGHCLVATNIMSKNDLLDYMLDTKNGNVFVKYSYYSNKKDETKYISSSFKIL